MAKTAGEVATGVAKEAANTWIGMNNSTHAFTGWGNYVEPYQPANKTQEASMNVTGDVAFLQVYSQGRHRSVV